MTALTNTPTNKNFLSPLGFKFQIKKAPHVNYFIQSASVPSLTLGETALPSPFVRMPIAGDHIQFTPFTIVFKVDEGLKNYLELFRWIQAIGFPDRFDQYASLTTALNGSGEGVYSDITLTILSSAMNPIHEVVFKNAFPTSLSELVFTTTLQDVDYLEASATFSYQSFDIVTL